MTLKRRENKQTTKTTNTSWDTASGLAPSTKRCPECRKPKQSIFQVMTHAMVDVFQRTSASLSGSGWQSLSYDFTFTRQSFKRYAADFPWAPLEIKGTVLERKQGFSNFLNGILSCLEFNKHMVNFDIRIL